ncbi:iron-sulfur protein NUBPL isoform X2 [Drosophila ficusphila]|uniref:iron-sulfur protein NUBPL isoform X2 n=1 Tax=Drosophila ficusphila TaxID=30025 RepID=UPI0007E5F8C1|nr:iron-sulfur protein NUBPL isoform X2 [Drosophila ficusphila]
MLRQLTGSVKRFYSKLSGHQAALMARGLPKKKHIIGVQDIIVIASGKGGVGKSTVAANFACSMARLGKRVGLLDGDIFGPTVPLLMNVHNEPAVNDRNFMIPPQNYNVKCLSMGMLTPPESSVIWRGPLVMSAIQRLLQGVEWGVILVTTPHAAAVQVTVKGARMYEKLNVPIFGLVENMKYAICKNCNQPMQFFKDNLMKSLPRKLISLPLDSHIAECCESGVPVVIKYPDSEYSSLFTELALQISEILDKKNYDKQRSDF